jgi:SAM-dependent methyltransferase
MSAQPLCRFCGTPLRHTFADLGRTPLANALLFEDDLSRPEPTYPLHARVCTQCYLVQIEAMVTPEELFGDYLYYSSYSTTWLEHARAFAEDSSRRFDLDGRSLVIEVASNDGYLLRYFQDRGIPVLGIEPARNIAAEANRAGIPTEVEFFGVPLAQSLAARGLQPDLLVGNNVLAHVPDLNDFVGGLATLLKPDGVLSVEFPHLLNLIAEVQFDTIYHEHFSYFSLLAVERVFAGHGLRIFDVERVPTHGGSLRISAGLADSSSREVTPKVGELRDVESRAGLDQVATYERFSETVEAAKQSFRSFLETARDEGKLVAGYGAAAKGNTLLNTVGVSTDLIAYVVDRNPHKQGLFLPGSHIPVHAPEMVLESKPDFLLILPWNLKAEVMDQMSHIRRWGGEFVVAIPETRIVG